MSVTSGLDADKFSMQGYRRSKRLRLIPAPDEDHNDDDAPIRTFFDTQPAEVLAMLIRNMSTRPRYEHWRKHLSPRDILAILETRTKLADAAREDMPRLYKYEFYHRDDDDDNTGLRLDSEFESNLFAPLMVHLGASLRSISLDSTSIHSYSPSNPVSRDYCLLNRYLFERCTNNLKTLRLENFGDFPIEPILDIIGKHLESLHITEASRNFTLQSSLIDSIAKNCSQLKWLELSKPTLRERCLVDLWKGIGSTLERISIDINEIWFGKRNMTKHMLAPEALFMYCTRLERVDTYRTTYFARQIIADLLAKLHGRLKIIKIGSRNAEQTFPPALVDLFAKRPDLIVDADLSFRNGNTMMQTLGPRLRNLRIFKLSLVLENGVYNGGFALNGGAAICPNLESIRLASNDVYTNDFLKRILENSKNVTSFCYETDTRGQPIDRIIRTIGDGMPLLQTLTLTTYPLSNQSIDVLANKLWNLKRLVLRRSYAHSSGNAENTAVYLVDKVSTPSSFPVIESVEIDDGKLKKRSPRIADAAFACGKNMDLFVGGVAYRTAGLMSRRDD